MEVDKRHLKPTEFRLASKGKGGAGSVDFENKMIRGFSLITKGEALGYDVFVDDPFLDSVVKAGNKAGAHGLKSRFTHPGLSGDGLGSALGRVTGFTRRENQVAADLKFLDAASNSPSGDLPSYVMDLAKEAPDMFGASIVFSRDTIAERKFRDKHTDKGAGRFQSPDESNIKNLQHVRLSNIYAADIVDEPAANADGMFAVGGELAANADAMLSYLYGLTDQMPSVPFLGYHPDRLKDFFNNFLDRHNLSVETLPPVTSAGQAFEFLDENIADIVEKVEALNKRISAAELKYNAMRLLIKNRRKQYKE